MTAAFDADAGKTTVSRKAIGADKRDCKRRSPSRNRLTGFDRIAVRIETATTPLASDEGEVAPAKSQRTK